MHRNRYGAELESRKINLVVARGRRMGFDEHQLADLQQNIALALREFSFNPDHANGASETTVLVAIIDRQLLAERRKVVRQKKRFRSLDEEEIKNDSKQYAPHIPSAMQYEDRGEMQMDIVHALEQLEPADRRLCESLAAGESIHEIAQEQGCGWHTIKRQIERIRRNFREMGLEGWLEH